MEQLVGSLLNAHLAYGDAVLLELLGQDGVEEGVAARVEGQDEDGEDLGLLQGDQVEARARRQGEEGDGGPETISNFEFPAVTVLTLRESKFISCQQMKSVKTRRAMRLAILESLEFHACEPRMAQYILR